ncbi:hypothetical protein [Prochlorothrix hollandica]|uniref:hypothetical protein n=1 Tax=Prochlorothrix hollandica TaxID=1223 RepID=UPI0033401C75
MADEADRKSPEPPALSPWQQLQNSDDPFLAGLQFWLFFLLVFVAMGYPLALSILLGIVGGVAGGYIVQCWQVDPRKDQQPDADVAATAMVDSFNPARRSSKVRTRAERQQGFSDTWEGEEE